MSVTVEESPQVIGAGIDNKDVESIKSFVKKNKVALLQFWNGEIDSADFSKVLKKI